MKRRKHELEDLLSISQLTVAGKSLDSEQRAKFRTFIDGFLSYKYRRLVFRGTKRNRYCSSDDRSYFVSSTTSRSVAEKFKNEVLVIAWVPNKRMKCFATTYEGVPMENEIVERLRFHPNIKPVYEEQKEVCLKYGILPHYIIGCLVKDDFCINPNLFDDTRSVVEIFETGLEIDQTNFLEYLKDTDYKGYYEFGENEHKLKKIK